MAENLRDTDCIVCAVMDARCNQVYNALFEVENGEVKRLCEDRALLCDELVKDLENYKNCGKPIMVVGDGTDIFFPFAKDLENVRKTSPQIRFQNAVSVGLVATEKFNNGETVEAASLLPFYLRLPQAERELKAKDEKK